jgi:methionine-gamma-lyase
MRGLKTLELRLDRHCENAEVIAELLDAHPAVQTVYYPGLKSFAQHALAQRQMRRFGGILAFELVGGARAGQQFLNALQMISIAVSLGDAESLAQHPASMTHSTYTPQQREVAGIGDGLIRLSVGLETVQDLKHDLIQALDRLI